MITMSIYASSLFNLTLSFFFPNKTHYQLNRRSGPGSSGGSARGYLGTKRGSMSGAGGGDDGSIGSPLDDSPNDDSPA